MASCMLEPPLMEMIFIPHWNSAMFVFTYKTTKVQMHVISEQLYY